MEAWVLTVWVFYYGHGAAISAHDYASQVACEAAGKSLVHGIRETGAPGSYPGYLCTSRGIADDVDRTPGPPR